LAIMNNVICSDFIVLPEVMSRRVKGQTDKYATKVLSIPVHDLDSIPGFPACPQELSVPLASREPKTGICRRDASAVGATSL